MRAFVLLILVACGDGPGKQTVRGEPSLETFEARMCKCVDSACAQQVIADFARWTRMIKTPRGNTSDAVAIMDRYNACLTKALASRPSPP